MVHLVWPFWFFLDFHNYSSSWFVFTFFNFSELSLVFFIDEDHFSSSFLFVFLVCFLKFPSHFWLMFQFSSRTPISLSSILRKWFDQSAKRWIEMLSQFARPLFVWFVHRWVEMQILSSLTSWLGKYHQNSDFGWIDYWMEWSFRHWIEPTCLANVFLSQWTKCK